MMIFSLSWSFTVVFIIPTVVSLGFLPLFLGILGSILLLSLGFLPLFPGIFGFNSSSVFTFGFRPLFLGILGSIVSGISLDLSFGLRPRFFLTGASVSEDSFGSSVTSVDNLVL